MRHVVYIIIFSLLLWSCSDNEEPADTIVNRPPYKAITDSIQHSPNNAELYYHRGSLFYSNNNLLHAEQDLKKAWDLDPTEEHALSLTTVLKLKNTDSAISFLQQALKKMPGSIALNIGLARGYQAKGKLNEAIQICDRLLVQFPNQLDALILKSELLQAQNKPAEALAVMETAYSYAPFDKEIAYDLAYHYAEQKKPKAIALADSLIRTDSSETAARAYYIKATYFRNIGRKQDAIKNYDAASRINYNFLDAYLDKGIYLFEQKDFSEAQETFMLGLKISPATADFYYWIGKTQEATGNKAEAKLNYQRAYSLDKTIVEAKAAADRLSP